MSRKTINSFVRIWRYELGNGGYFNSFVIVYTVVYLPFFCVVNIPYATVLLIWKCNLQHHVYAHMCRFLNVPIYVYQ